MNWTLLTVTAPAAIVLDVGATDAWRTDREAKRHRGNGSKGIVK